MMTPLSRRWKTIIVWVERAYWF